MFAHLLPALLERSIRIPALHPSTCLFPSEVAYANLTNQRGSRHLQMSNCFPQPSVSRSSRGPICLVAPEAGVVSSALACSVLCKNSRRQHTMNSELHFPVAKCYHFDSQWQMLSDTFGEESQRKVCLCTKAHHWQLIVTRYKTCSSEEQLMSGMWLFPGLLLMH